MEEKRLLLEAEWTNDCQGKKDYDGNIVSISTRYWPRGGSFLLVDTGNGSISDGTDPARQGIKPHANSSLMLRFKDSPYSIDLIEKNFEGETEEEVKAQVEQWAQEQMDRVVAILRKEYSV